MKKMQNVYSVAQVNSYIKNMFTQDYMLQSLFVKGEVSNCKYHSSGHIYFTLKDEKGTIACVMFAGNRQGLKFRLAEGMQVVVGGTVDVYERDGRYQLYARQIIPDGTGFLYEKFEKLKEELMERGMFAPEYKKPVPRYVKKVGVVTAPTGAAVRDIINITRRRNRAVQIILYPAVVQGDQAPQSIVNGIRALENLQVDVMIVGRGGGSIEDLWAFNEEIVAQAVFDCSVPVISAVGHETDTTIVDFVADLRAPTPSAAAELAVFELESAEDKLAQTERRLKRLMQNQCGRQEDKLQQYRTRLKYLSPVSRIRQKRTHALQLEEKLQYCMERKLSGKRHGLELYIEKMKGLSPLEKLNQGFSYVTDERGRNVRDVDRVDLHDLLRIQVKNGELLAEVQKKEKREWN